MQRRIRVTGASRTWGALAFCSIGLIGLLASGCGEMEETAIASPTSTEAALSALPQGFTLSDLPSDLALSSEQSSAMGRAIDQLKSARQARRGARPDFSTNPPPMIAFLEESSRVLSPDQFVVLARFLNERRMSRQHELGGRMQEMGERWAKRHGGSGAEREQFRQRFAEQRGAIQELRRQVEEGTISLEAARDRMKELRRSMQQRARSNLTLEESANRESMRNERMAKRLEQRLASLPDAMERRADFLGRVLGLDTNQTASVRSILMESVEARRSTLEQLRSGSIEPEDAAYSAWGSEREIATKVRALLTPEQVTRFDALESLLPKGLRMNGALHR